MLLLLAAVTELACRKPNPGPPPRYAILRFENLSGDRSLDWTGRAAAETLSVSLAVSLNGALDGPVLKRQEALQAGATRLIAGYVERSGGEVRITATEADGASGT